MGQSGRVWKWTGMVLAVLCGALGIIHVLLTRTDTFDNQPAADSRPLQSIAPPDGNSAAQVISSLDEGAGPHSRSEISKQQESHEPTQLTKRGSQSENPKEIVAGKGPEEEGLRVSASIDDRPSSTLQSVQPLGIVETAGGRVQAVIQDGEWTRLVEEGEVLADNSRVLKVSAEGVEILRPASLPAIELARAGNAPAGETKPEIAVAAQSAAVNDEPIGSAEPVQARGSRAILTRARASDDLPGMQTGEATFHAAAPKLAPSAVPQRALKPVLPSQTDLRPSPVVGIDRPVAPNAALGRVEYTDGRIQAVVADGQWVKLVAEPATSGPDFNQAKDKATTVASGVEASPNSEGSSESWRQGMDPGSVPMTLGGGASRYPLPGSGLSQTSESEIPNSVEPIGIVEWPGGRAQAVIIEGLSVSLVDDAETLDEARRALALISSPRESGIDPRLYDSEQAGRQREDESGSLALMEDESPTRGPPDEFEPPLGLPEELARGQPEDDGLADPSRAPPFDDSLESRLLEDDLPGFEDAAAARIEPLQSIKIIPDAILGRSQGGVTGSVSEIYTNKSPQTLSAPESPADHEQNTRRNVLGYVRMLDGRQRAVLSVGDSVMLVEEVSDARAVQTERPAPAGHVVVTSHPQTGGAHPTAGEPFRSGLQSGPRIRDNQGQSHR